MKDLLKDIVIRNPRNYGRLIRSQTDLFRSILDATSFLPADTSLATRLFYIFNDLGKQLKCKACGADFTKHFTALEAFDENEILCMKCKPSASNEYIKSKLREGRIFTEDESKLIEAEFDKAKLLSAAEFRAFRESCWSKDKLYLLQYLDFKFPQLKDLSLTTKFYWQLNNLTDFPTCEICGKPIMGNVFSLSRGYSRSHDKDCKFRLAEKTSLKKYGTKNAGNSEISRRHAKETMLERHGCEYFSQSGEEWDSKTKSTKLRRYGDQNYVNVEKAKTTKLSRYGDEDYNNRAKCKETCLEKYGVANPIQIPDVQRKVNLRKSALLYDRFENDELKPLFSKDFFLKIDSPDKHNVELDWHCKKCGMNFKLSVIRNGGFKVNSKVLYARCPSCYKVAAENSRLQYDVAEFIQNDCSHADCLLNDRKTIAPLEIDIYLPAKKVGFEIDGLYWHSDDSKPHDYHLMKTQSCEDVGIHLIHVFENEWVQKQEIVKSRIKNMLGVIDEKIGARQCKVVEVDSKTARDFQEQNHIQGWARSSVNLGLLFEDSIVSLMTFSKPRFDKKHEWELVRFCNRLNCCVSGGASKLLSYFEHAYHPKNIVSYADRRWTMNNGNTVYDKLGFKLDHVSAPNYWYWKNKTGILESRLKYQKHRLEHLLPIFDKSKTEQENMKLNGYNRIFDCGCLVYEKTF